MKEYIQIPYWINKLDEIKSDRIQQFLRMFSTFQDNKIDIDYLRKYYMEYPESFIELVDELSLRGFEFFSNKQNNLLPKLKHDKEGHYLLVKENKELYSNVDFIKFGMGNLTTRFKVESDEFFNYIPLTGFKLFNPHFELEELYNEFSKRGFNLIPFNSSDFVCGGSIEKMTLKKIEVQQDSIDNFEENSKKHIDNRNENSYYDNLSEEINLEKFALTPAAGLKKITDAKDLISDIKNDKSQATDICNADPKSIEDLFAESKYRLFKKFCDKKGISNILEVTDETFVEFSKRPMVGKKKVEDVKEIINDALKFVTKGDIKKQMEDFVVNIDAHWLDKLKDCHFSMICKTLNENCTLNKDLKISEMQNKTINQLELEGDLITFNKVLKIINSIKPPTITLAEIENSTKDQRMCEIVNLRYTEGYTLEKISQNFNLTRERVRQILVKFNNKFKRYLSIKKFRKAIKLEFINKKFCTFKEFYELFKNEDICYANLIIKEERGFYVFKPLELLYFEDNKECEKIDEFIDKLPKCFNFYDNIDELIENIQTLDIENPTIDQIEALLSYYNYNSYGEFFSKEKLTIGGIVNLIFENYIEKPMKLDEDGYEFIKKISKEYLNFDITSSIRSVDRCLRDNKEIILTDSKTFLHLSKLKYKEEIMDSIEIWMDEKLSDNSVVYPGDIFLEHESVLVTSGINSKYTLYALVSYYFGDKYTIGKGNTLSIFTNPEFKQFSREDYVVEILEQNNGTISKKELVDLTNWEIYKVDDTICKSNRLLKLGSTITTIDRMEISDAEKEEFAAVVNKLMFQNGFTSSLKLFKEMIFHPVLCKFLNKNKIDDKEKLASITKKFFPFIKGRTHFLYTESSKYTSFEEVMFDTFKDSCTKDEIKELATSFGYKEMMCGIFVKKAINENQYVEISQDELLASNKFNLENEAIDNLVDYIEEQLGENEYISLNNLSGYRKRLPRIDYKWNPYLMRSLLKDKGYRPVCKIYDDPRYERIIMVRESSEIKSFDHLIYHIIKNEYEGNMHEVKIYEFLESKGIFYKQDCITDRKLPYEVRTSKWFKVDELGRVELIEV